MPETTKKAQTVRKKPVKKTVSTKKATAKKTVSTKKTPVKKAPIKKRVSTKKTSTKKINFIKGSLLDVLLLYKNFIHWNISKIFIFLWSIIIGGLAVIPLIILIFIYGSIFNVDILMLLNGSLSGNIIYGIIGYFLLLIIVVTFFIFFSYSNILLMKVNNSYLDGKKLGYKLNDYFDFKIICKYFNLTLLSILILLIPVLLFIVLIGILFLFSGSLDEINKLVLTSVFNYFTISSFIILVLSSIISVYLFYRIVFSYLVFTDPKYYDNKNSVIFYIKKSLSKTKGIKNFFKFLTVFLLFSIILSPVSYFGEVLENNKNNLSIYGQYLNLSDENKANISTEDLYYIESLKLKYNDLDLNDVNKKININNIYLTLFSVFGFVFLSGFFVMVTSSFYRRELV